MTSTSGATARVDALRAHLATAAALTQSAAGPSKGLTTAPTSSANVHVSHPQVTVTQRQPSAYGRVGVRSPTDVVVVAAKRTAVTRANRGAFKDTTPDELLKAVLEAVVRESGVPASAVGDVAVGNVQQVGSYVTPARTAQLRAGFPVDVPLRMVNRQCGSGLEAIASVAAAIATGFIDVGVAGGVEHMTSGGSPNDAGASLPPMNLEAIMEHDKARDALVTMGITSENVALKHGVTRREQDEFAAWSHAKALAAQAAGLFNDEIVPVSVRTASGAKVVVDQDDGPRPGSTPEVLAKLKPSFSPTGTTTAGNASPVNDGASAVMLMRRADAERAGARVLGTFRGYKAVGVEPALMGVGPAAAVPAVLAECGLTVADVDVFEINEAFASQAVFCAKQLGIPTAPGTSKLNPVGGAIALGHALGSTGSRLVVTLLHHLNRTHQRVGVVSACAGGGYGVAAVWEAA